jgi:hypothetical protein
MSLYKTSTLDWNLDSVPWEKIELSLIKKRTDLFYILTAASFVEITADLYADNLAIYFSDYSDIVELLNTVWKKEEVRYGQTLRKYVNIVWPDFDWEKSYSAFYEDYSRTCEIGSYEKLHGLEMVARCVIETGTASFYEALSFQSSEEVLQGITSRIRAEEIKHYKYFYHSFKRLNDERPIQRLEILFTIIHRLIEVRKDDTECALWHVYCQANPQFLRPNKDEFNKLFKKLIIKLRSHYPIKMAIKMLIKPLRLPAKVNNLICHS